MGTENVRHMSTLTLIGRVASNFSLLFEREVELAKVELRETAMETVRGAGMLIAGALIGILALAALVMAGVLALALMMPGWLAGLVAFAVLAIAAGVLLLVAKNELQGVREHPLNRTRTSLREDMQWASHRLTSSER